MSDFEIMQGFEQKVVHKEININFGFEDNQEEQKYIRAAGDYHKEGGMVENQN